MAASERARAAERGILASSRRGRVVVETAKRVSGDPEKDVKSAETVAGRRASRALERSGQPFEAMLA